MLFGHIILPIICFFLLIPSVLGQSDRVVIFNDHNFQGANLTLRGDWNGTGGFDRIVRSIRVPPGMRVTLFSQRNFRGTRIDIDGDWNPGPSSWWSNRVRSIRISGSAPIHPPVTSDWPVVYAQPNFQGPAMAVERDWAGSRDWEGNPHRIRSILVPPGWSLTLFRQRNFRGGETTINSSVSWDSPGQPWNGTTRSIRVHRPVSPPVRPPVGSSFPIIFAQPNLRGASLAIERDFAGNRAWDGNPNRIRSVRVPPGWYLVVYDRRNFQGRSFNVDNDWTPQPGEYWYGRIRSIRVHRGSPPIQPR